MRDVIIAFFRKSAISEDKRRTQLHDGPYLLCRGQQEPWWTRQRNLVLPYKCAWSSRVPGRRSLLNGVR